MNLSKPSPLTVRRLLSLSKSNGDVVTKWQYGYNRNMMDEGILETNRVELHTSETMKELPDLVPDPLHVKQAEAQQSPMSAEDTVRSRKRSAPLSAQLAAALISSFCVSGLTFAIVRYIILLNHIRPFDSWLIQKIAYLTLIAYGRLGLIGGVVCFGLFAWLTRIAKVPRSLALIIALILSFTFPIVFGPVRDVGSVYIPVPNEIDLPFLNGTEYLAGMLGAVSAMVSVLLINARYLISQDSRHNSADKTKFHLDLI